MVEAKPLTKPFGAEVTGVDLRISDASTGARVRELWLRHKLLLFRDQQLSEEQIVAFSKCFGPLEIHLRKEFLSRDNPEILIVSNVKQDGRAIGILADTEVGWHYDQIYLERPAIGSLLYSVRVPPSGGNTYFADMNAAYEALSDDIKRRIDGRMAVQSYEAFNRMYSVPASKAQKRQSPDIQQPMVRTHPYTGRKALYICPGMTVRIVGLREEESTALLDELFEWCVRPEFVYTHRWREGDALLWDNACTMHRRDPFDARHQRIMKRTTILPEPEKARPF